MDRRALLHNPLQIILKLRHESTHAADIFYEEYEGKKTIPEVVRLQGEIRAYKAEEDATHYLRSFVLSSPEIDFSVEVRQKFADLLAKDRDFAREMVRISNRQYSFLTADIIHNDPVN